jgi:hypothetical protein
MENDKKNGLDKLLITKEQQLTLISMDKSLTRIGFWAFVIGQTIKHTFNLAEHYC